MFPTFDVPALWIPSGTAQRMSGLSVVKSITFGPNEQGMYWQALSQNVRITIDGVTNPVVGGNDLGFELAALALPTLFVGYPGMKLLIIQVAASAVLQYQMLKLGGRF